MSTPARFAPNGMTNVAAGTTLGMYGAPDRTKYIEYFNDFHEYVAADWTVTETGVATQALTDIAGGALLVTNAAADNDSSESQLVGESFLLASGKKCWFKARLKVSDATQSDFIVGLVITDTTAIDGVTDGVYFLKDDGDTNIDFHVEKNSTDTTTTAVGTAADDTFVALGFYYNGSDTIEIYVDDVKVGTSVTTNVPDDTELTVTFGIQNGEAVAKTMTVDYLFAAIER